MTVTLLFRRVVSLSATATCVALLCSLAQSEETKTRAYPSSADYKAASEATNVSRHAWRANTPTGRRASRAVLSNRHSTRAASALASAAPDSGGPRYPADLIYQGGEVVVSMESHAIYMNPNGACTVASCWGNPMGFLRDLGRSNMIHIVDQYVGSTDNHRYRVAEESTHINYVPPATPFTDADMLAIVHSVVVAGSEDGHYATGYGHEYHIFLPPGQDQCFTSAFTVCYSPDNPATYFYCAYHGSADFGDIGHVLYSVEPFQDVGGCSSRPGTPNGQLTDSTNNVLSHETFETITDPDGTAWWNSLDNGIYGEEIGDECSFLAFDSAGNFLGFDPSNVTLNGKAYTIQPEYDNSAHACTTAP